ncbi:2-oxo acid dehydrogenase subunit E2, partial [Myxococcota bacterium]|nr:2-oxo acid dehydrogenase subunit E2 [Myxococcota bacterium]
AEATPFATRLPTPAEELRTALPTPVADDEPAAATKRAPAYRAPGYQPQPQDRVVPFSRRREQIAGHMVHSLHTAAHVFALGEIDMSRVMAAKSADAPVAERSGIKLTFMPYVVAAVARALAEHPELNATVVGDSLVLRGERNVGVAVDTEEGLVVPVVRRADELGLLGIARAIHELSERARHGKLTPADLGGGSFTISNPGKDGNLYGVSIIRQPEVAILRMGSIVKRPVVREIEGEDVIVVRPMMYAALSYDHRVIDGRKGNGFLTRLTQLLASQRPVLAT